MPDSVFRLSLFACALVGPVMYLLLLICEIETTNFSKTGQTKAYL